MTAATYANPPAMWFHLQTAMVTPIAAATNSHSSATWAKLRHARSSDKSRINGSGNGRLPTLDGFVGLGSQCGLQRHDSASAGLIRRGRF